MKILCCFKIVPDYEMLDETEWIQGGLPDTRFIRNVYSCYDESALELVLREKDRQGCETEALTVKKPELRFPLEALYAVGYDRVTELLCSQRGHTAEQIADYVCNDAVDCIVMGCQSQDGNGFQTPYQTAELLKWPCISDVYNFSCTDGEKMRVWQREKNVCRELLVQLPCVLSIGNVPKTFLRIPTLRQKMDARGKVVLSLPCREKEYCPEPVLEEVQYLRKYRNTKVLTKEQMQQKIGELEGRRLQKSGEL